MPIPHSETEIPPLAAVCGLYCGACSVYLATREDPQRLPALAARLGQTEAETRCGGCRAEMRSVHCRSCDLASCASGRGIAFCGECAEFPCARFQTFRSALPHRREILRDLSRILESGVDAWMREIPERYACPSCNITNSAYDLACRHCGHQPGSAFAAAHGAAIQSHLSQR